MRLDILRNITLNHGIFEPLHRVVALPSRGILTSKRVNTPIIWIHLQVFNGLILHNFWTK